MKKNYNRNPEGFNQWTLRKDTEEIQKIINKYPKSWTKQDFRGEGINNSKKILTRTETQRPGLKFGTKKNFNRNPKGFNKWTLRTDEEIQKIINKYPNFWTKKDFRGEGINNSKKILTRTETQRPGLKFGQTGRGKQSLKEVYKYSTPESIVEFEKKLISEETFRDRARVKKQRDLMSLNIKKKKDKERYSSLTDKQLEAKRRSNKAYRERIKT
jgi:hypothetical protein